MRGGAAWLPEQRRAQASLPLSDPLYAKAAAPVSDAQIIRVCSSDYQAATGQPCEDIARDQHVTQGDHGGVTFWVTTQVLGYADGMVYLTADGAPLEMIQSTSITQDDSVVGFTYVWDASGLEGGKFRFQATSENLPRVTKYDDLTIK